MDEFNNAKALIDNADAILISASNGLSISEGYNIFAEDEAFKNHFARFTKLYGIHNILQGALGKLPEDAHNEFIMELQKYLVEEYTPTKAFASLKKLIGNHDYFILTSNADTHFQLNDFAADKIWEIEGNFFDNEQNSPDWKYQQQNYQEFMKKYAAKKVVQLELGIGKQNQMLKAPLMAIVSQLPTWSYVTLNLPNELLVNSAIKNRSVTIGGDITTNLTKLVEAEPNSNFIEEMQNQKRQFDYEDLVMKTQMNYSNYYSVYAQGGTAEPLSDKAPLPYDEQIKVMAQKSKKLTTLSLVVLLVCRQPVVVISITLIHHLSISTLASLLKSMVSSVLSPGCATSGKAVKNFGDTWQPSSTLLNTLHFVVLIVTCRNFSKAKITLFSLLIRILKQLKPSLKIRLLRFKVTTATSNVHNSVLMRFGMLLNQSKKW